MDLSPHDQEPLTLARTGSRSSTRGISRGARTLKAASVVDAAAGATVTLEGLTFVAESAKGRRNRIGTVLIKRA